MRTSPALRGGMRAGSFVHRVATAADRIDRCERRDAADTAGGEHCGDAREHGADPHEVHEPDVAVCDPEPPEQPHSRRDGGDLDHRARQEPFPKPPIGVEPQEVA